MALVLGCELKREAGTPTYNIVRVWIAAVNRAAGWMVVVE